MGQYSQRRFYNRHAVDKGQPRSCDRQRGRTGKRPHSILNYFRQIVRLRKDNLVLVYGKYTLVDKDNPDVYAYTREGYGKKMLIMLNFKAHPATANTGFDLSRARLLLDNYPETLPADTLRPYEARVYELAAL